MQIDKKQKEYKRDISEKIEEQNYNDEDEWNNIKFVIREDSKENNKIQEWKE